MKKSIEFIQNPESLTKVNLSEIRGGKSISADDGCVGHCSGSSCNGQSSDAKEMISVC